jgi:hypothetical protein
LVYIVSVRTVVFGAIQSLVNPRENFNLTAFSKVSIFEKTNAGRVLVNEALGRDPLAAKSA